MIWFLNQRHKTKNIKELREELIVRDSIKQVELYKNSVEVTKASAQLACVPCQLIIHKDSQVFTSLLTKYALMTAKLAQFVNYCINDFLVIACPDYLALSMI